MRRLLTAVLALIWAGTAHAQITQIIGNGVINPGGGSMYAPLMVLNSQGSTGPSTTALTAITLSPNGSGSAAWVTTSRLSHIPTAMTLRNLIAHAETTITSGDSYTFTVMKNGSPTALQCYVNNANPTCSCDPNAPQNCSTGGTSGIAFSAGDSVYIQSCPQTNDPPTLTGGGNTCAAVGTSSSSVMDVNLMTQSPTGDAPIFAYTGTSLTTSGAGTYNSFGLTHGNAASDAVEADVIPNGNGGSGTVGTISKFDAWATTTPTGVTSWTVTIYQNGSPSAIACTLDSTHNPCSDTTHSITVAAGDTISIQTVPNSTPPGTLMTFDSNWHPTTLGEYPIFELATALPQNTGTRFLNLNGYSVSGTTSPGTTNTITPAATSVTVKGPSLSISTAPSSTFSRIGTVYYGTTPAGMAASTVTCSITGTNTTCSQSPSTSQTINGSSPSQLNYFNWEWTCSNASCAAITWAHMGLMTTVIP